jgi:signal transduction histidine kinase
MDMAPDAAGLRVQISVRSLSRPPGECVAITYEDNGPGVPTELKESIFEDFFSYRPGDKASTGLGLSYVRRVIAAHRGTVRESGAPGQGARFVIEIPRFLQITDAKE